MSEAINIDANGNEEQAFGKATKLGAQHLIDYFSKPKEQRDMEAAQMGLKAGSTYARVYSGRTNRAAVALATAKFIGLKGEELAPVFESISGIKASQFLPDKRERSGGKRKAAK